MSQILTDYMVLPNDSANRNVITCMSYVIYQKLKVNIFASKLEKKTQRQPSLQPAMCLCIDVGKNSIGRGLKSYL